MYQHLAHLRTYKVGYGRANGTFGELLQGVLPDQKSFMVTFPINLFSYVSFAPNHSIHHVTVYPKEKQKSATIAEFILKHFQISIGGTLTITSDIPESKGLASSSADLVATAYALQDSFNLPLDAKLITKFIAKIEPTDGVMYPGIVSFYYKEVLLKEYISKLPEISIISVDEGRGINTLEYNLVKKKYTPLCKSQYKRMLSAMTKAIKENDLQKIGEIATQSAIMNQKHNFKNFLQPMIDLCKEVEGLGVAVAHSGTFVGILFDSNSKNIESQKIFCCSKIKEYGKSAHIFHSLVLDEVSAQGDPKAEHLGYIC